MKNIKLILSTIVFTSLISCVNGDDYGTPDLSTECVTMSPTKEIVDVKNLATTTPLPWLDDDVIEAYITSSDEGGNFYKSISMVAYDQNGDEFGFSIPVDEYNLYTKFEPGRKVFIKLKNRYFGTKYNGLLIGNLYNGEIGRLGIEEYKNIIFRSCEKVNEDELIHSFTNISQALNDQYINKLIEFENVQFVDDAVGSTYYDENSTNTIGGATNHQIVDFYGNKVIIRTSSFATFTKEIVPSQNGKIRCVLTKYVASNGTASYQFMLRTINDVKLTNERYTPTVLFQETFDTNFPNWVKQNVAGTNQWAVQATFGNPTYNAYINGFGNNNEDWLISPAIDLSTNDLAILSFETSTRYNGPALQVYVSSNYNGSGVPSTATWTQLSGFNLPVYTSGSYTSWSSGASGGIDISTYAGNSNVRVAFKYTSTTSSAAAWEVDNVKIIGQ